MEERFVFCCRLFLAFSCEIVRVVVSPKTTFCLLGVGWLSKTLGWLSKTLQNSTCCLSARIVFGFSSVGRDVDEGVQTGTTGPGGDTSIGRNVSVIPNRFLFHLPTILVVVKVNEMQPRDV